MTREGFPHSARPRGAGKRTFAMVVSGVCVLGVCLIARYYWGAGHARAESPLTPAQSEPAVSSASATLKPTDPSQAPAAATASPTAADAMPAAAADTPSRAADKPVPHIVAYVNGHHIDREELAREALRHHGKEVLENMVNRQLIVAECQNRGITIAAAEVDAEIGRMAKQFRLPVDQWLKLLKQEKNFTPEQYATDVVWPTLALRALAGKQLSVSQEELLRAFEAAYGPAVQVRLIALSDAKSAEEVRAQAAAHPEKFGDLAKQRSEDSASASLKGMVQPIRQHGTLPAIEEAAFALSDGQVSQVVNAGGQYVIIKREGLIPARNVKLEQVSADLEHNIRERKLRKVASEIFAQLQSHAFIQNILNDPVKSRQMPGVAAVVNGAQISIRSVAEQCVERHGMEVLDGMIHRRLIELACKQQNITVSEAEIDAEIAHVAAMSVKSLPDGKPDTKAFLDLVTKQQHLSVEVYRQDAVWPTVALKKLVGSKVEVTEEDLQKGYEANYGAKAQCLAIVLNNLRRAQQVWDMARRNPTPEYFGQLAAQYSIEASSRALGGKVPPICKFAGQPLLEDEAFKLKPGELSGVIQVDDKYVILLCQSFTKRAEVELSTVRDLIADDLREKKQQVAMMQYMMELQDHATIDNYLTGKNTSPLANARHDAAVGSSMLRQVPGVR
jgi:parvulin-like peptidyl-prolyl isomerase